MHGQGRRVADRFYAVKVFALLTVLSAFPLLCPIAAAETSEERQSCFSDAFRVCWAAIPNRDDVFHCLMDNRSRLSPDCRTVMDQYRHPRRVRHAVRHRMKAED